MFPFSKLKKFKFSNSKKAKPQVKANSTMRLGMELLEARDVPSVGGGFTNSGLTGVYYSDPNFTTQAFSRRDVRIDFDWGTTNTPGGSNSTGFNSVGLNNYSAQWTGQLIPKFSETYTFSGIANDALLLQVRPSGATQWTTVVNKLPTDVMNYTGFYTFQAGQTYDIKLSFQKLLGPGGLTLSWSSPSTPTEIIDPLSQSGLNNPDGTSAFVDIVKGARNSWDGTSLMDSNGWPMADTSYYFQESLNQGLGVDPLMLGTIHFSFQGSAAVGLRGNVDQSSLTYSYNSATNTTTGSFKTVDLGLNASSIYFTNSHRNGQPTGPAGLTNLQLYRPVSPNATGAYPNGTIFTTNIKSYIENYTVIRFQLVANQQVNWSDRTLPSFFNQANGVSSTGPYPTPWEAAPTADNMWSWEYEIMLANETGSDLMLSIPPLASNQYITNLANLLRYGSDGVNPYTAPTVNPKYPPLNSNLRVYLELGNELWNWNSVFYNDFNNINQLVKNAADANNADFKAFNYDNLSTAKNANGEYVNLNTWRYRYIILRMEQISAAFRTVFGDIAMPGNGNTDVRVRPLYEWQYANSNNTASIALTWADRYFNKSDPASTYTGPAMPVNYFLWGGGGATYYSANNPNGLTTLLPNSGFEDTQVAAGYNQNPAGASWTFTGTAGIARPGSTTTDIPAAYDGNQMAYIAGTGSITNTFTTPTNQVSNQYAFSFKAMNRLKSGATVADTQNLRVYLDYGTANQVDITASTYSQTNGYTPPDLGSLSTPWAARNVFWTESGYYYTKAVALTPGSTHKVTIIGTAASTQIAFIEDVHVTSVDAIFAGGIPGGGEANGQPAGQNIRDTMNGSVNWAVAFGLQDLAYEGGWSLGGDDGGSFVQLLAKYGDSRTKTAQSTFMNYFDQAGGAVNVFGTYSQVPLWDDYYAQQGMINSSSYPIIGGINQRANQLGPTPTNGTRLPAVLTSTNVTLSDNADPSAATVSSAGGWLTWNVVVPMTGNYTMNVVTQSGGSYVVLVDEVAQVVGASGGTLSATARLTAGLHAVKVRSTSGTISVNSITVVAQNAPASPAISALTSRNDSVSINWNPVTGASGYIVMYGTSPGSFTTRLDAGSSTSTTINGLTNNTTYYFAVSSYVGNGAESLPSGTRSVGILVEGLVGQLANWQLAGIVNTGATAPSSASATGVASGLTVSALSRGAGLVPATSWVSQFFPNRFASEANGNIWAQTLASAITNKQYYQFTVSANAGVVYNLGELDLQVWFSDSGNANNQVAIQFSKDGVNFTSLSYTGTLNTDAGMTATLSTIQSLQSLTGTVTFRVYSFGSGNYSANGIGLGTANNALVVQGSLKSTPTVTATVIGDGTAERSMVNQLSVAFSTYVTLGANALTVTPQAGGAAIPVAWTTANVDGRTVATLTFPSGSIADGRWTLNVNGSAVTNAAGGIVMNSNVTNNFFRLFGDVNGDAIVNGSDMFAFRPTMGALLGQSVYMMPFDYNGDGVINGTDFFQFRNRYGLTI